MKVVERISVHRLRQQIEIVHTATLEIHADN